MTQVQINTKYTKNYATRANAEKAADAQLAKLADCFKNAKLHPRYVLVACGENDDRFAPAFLNVGYTAGYFAQDGFMVIGA